MTVCYFAYGSNLSVARMQGRIPEATVLGAAVLSDHRLEFNKLGRDGSAKANILPCPGERVWGAIYRFPRARLDELDAIEGGYERVRVTVRLRGGDARECQTYVSDRLTEALPFAWYKKLVVDGAREHCLPDDYVRDIERVPATPDGH